MCQEMCQEQRRRLRRTLFTGSSAEWNRCDKTETCGKVIRASGIGAR